MQTAAVTDLKARLSGYLKQVKAGQEVLITERGIPVAKLVPLQGMESRTTRRDRLARAGLLRPGTGKPRRSLLKPPAGKLPGKSVLEALLQERAEGR